MKTGVKILNILLAEAVPSVQLFHRPWEVNWRPEFTDALMETTNDGTNLSAGAIKRVANQMLIPSAAHTGAIQIAGGFGEQRFTVTFVVETENVGGRKTQEIISGYTDHMGIGGTDTNPIYNPEMRFFFNHMGTLQVTQGSGALGYGMFTFGNATEILTPMTGWDSQEHIPMINRQATAMRPRDVLASMGEGAFSGMGITTGQSQLNGAPVLANTGYQFGARAKRSSFDNTDSAEYLSRVFTSVRDVSLSNEGDARQYGTQLQQAGENNYTAEPLTSNSAMLLLLQRRSSFQQEWSVTLGELCQIDPTIAQRIQPIRMKREYVHTMAAMMGNTDGWGETSAASQVAQLATMIMPNAMAKFALGMIHFIAHTDTLDGSVDLRIMNAAGIAQGIDPKPILNMIRHHLIHEVYPTLTKQGQIKLYIEANISLNRISNVVVAINGGEKKPFPIATYCSALYSPNLAPNVQRLETLASDLSVISSQLTAAAINHGPGILRPDGEQFHNMNYGGSSIAATPVSELNLSMPTLGGNPGVGNGRGF